MLRVAEQSELQTPADKFWGYPFGSSGLMGTEQVCEFLGNCHRHTLDNLVGDRKIRKGKSGSRAVYCRRSIEEYVRGIEV